MLAPSGCRHEELCSHLLIEVLLCMVTVLQYSHSVAAELLEKCRCMIAWRIFLVLQEQTRKHNIVQRTIVIQLCVLKRCVHTER